MMTLVRKHRSTALDFEELILLGAAPQQALDALRTEGRKYDRRVPDALATAEVFTGRTGFRLDSLSPLRFGMIFEEEVRNTKGILLVSRGQEIRESLPRRLRNYAAPKLLTKAEFRARMPKCAESAPVMSAA